MCCIHLLCCLCVFSSGLTSPVYPICFRGTVTMCTPSKSLKRSYIKKSYHILTKARSVLWGVVFVWGQKGKWLPCLLRYSSDLHQPELVQGPQAKGTASNKSAQTSAASAGVPMPPTNHMDVGSGKASPHSQTVYMPTISHLISINSHVSWGVHCKHQRYFCHWGDSRV